MSQLLADSINYFVVYISGIGRFAILSGSVGRIVMPAVSEVRLYWPSHILKSTLSLNNEHAAPCYWPSPDPEILSHRNRNWADCRVCKN